MLLIAESATILAADSYPLNVSIVEKRSVLFDFHFYVFAVAYYNIIIRDKICL